MGFQSKGIVSNRQRRNMRRRKSAEREREMEDSTRRGRKGQHPLWLVVRKKRPRSAKHSGTRLHVVSSQLVPYAIHISFFEVLIDSYTPLPVWILLLTET